MGIGVVRIDGDRALERRDAFLLTVEAQQDNATVIVRKAVFWNLPDPLVEGDQRLFVTVQLFQRVAEIIIAERLGFA